MPAARAGSTAVRSSRSAAGENCGQRWSQRFGGWTPWLGIQRKGASRWRKRGVAVRRWWSFRAEPASSHPRGTRRPRDVPARGGAAAHPHQARVQQPQPDRRLVQRRGGRAEAGRNPYDRALSDLIGELATRSEEFRTRWAAHNVRFHRTGTKQVHHPIVGDLDLTFEAMELPADPGLTFLAYTTEAASPSQDALELLASWAATLDLAASATDQAPGRSPA